MNLAFTAVSSRTSVDWIREVWRRGCGRGVQEVASTCALAVLHAPPRTQDGEDQDREKHTHIQRTHTATPEHTPWKT